MVVIVTVIAGHNWSTHSRHAANPKSSIIRITSKFRAWEDLDNQELTAVITVDMNEDDPYFPDNSATKYCPLYDEPTPVVLDAPNFSYTPSTFTYSFLDTFTVRSAELTGLGSASWIDPPTLNAE